MQRYVKSVFLAFAVAIIITGCSDGKTKMLFLGDSMIAGDNGTNYDTFVSMLGTQFQDFEIVDQGSSDWTTRTFLQQLDDMEDDFPSNVEFVFIQLGINDLRQYGHSDSTITNCMRNIESITSQLSTYLPQANIVLLSNLMVDRATLNQNTPGSGFNNTTNAFLSRIAAGYSLLASDNGYMFIDLHRMVPAARTNDGMYLDEQGHTIVASIISRFLRELEKARREG